MDIKASWKKRKTLKHLRMLAGHRGEWDVNDIGSVSLRMKDGSTTEYLFFWPYGWKDGLSINPNEINKLLQCQTIDEVYDLERM